MQSTGLKRALLAGGTALVLTGGAIGLVSAQQTPTPVPPAQGQSAPARPGPQAFIDALARRLGITSERLQQAMAEARNEVGVLDRGGKHRFGPGGPGGPRGFGPGRGGAALSVAAQAIGISEVQLKQELNGQSLAQVAQAHGKNPADVATALKNAANQRIDQAVSAARMTAEQAERAKQQVAQRIDQQMDQVRQQGQGPRSRERGPNPPTAPGQQG